MSPKRAFTLLLGVVLASGGASLAMISTSTPGSAAGSQFVPLAAQHAQPTFQVSKAAPQHPAANLNLGTTLHLVDKANGANRLDSSHLVYTGLLTKQGSRGSAGSAAYTCVTKGQGIQSCHGALALRGGILLITLTLNTQNSTASGQVTGGNGPYSGAHGNVAGRLVSATQINLTVTYSVN